MAKHGMPLLVHGEVTDPGGRRLRPRARVSRARARAARRALSRRSRSCWSTSRRARRREFVARAPARRRRDDHRASPAAQPQRAVRRRRAAASLLPAGRQARGAPRRRSSRRRRAATRKFFLGTDSAPHARHTKETSCGCAGIYTAHAGIELYAEAFDAAGRARQLDDFAEPLRGGLLRPAVQPGEDHARRGTRARCRRSCRSAPTRWCRFGPARTLCVADRVSRAARAGRYAA